MSWLCVAPIVEGDGEVAAVRGLLTRVWSELLGGSHVEVLAPIRGKRKQLVQEEILVETVQIAIDMLQDRAYPYGPSLVLVLLDSDTDCPAKLGPRLLSMAKAAHSHADIACVIAKKEYETWFVAAAESLAAFLDVAKVPEDPETTGAGKKWIEDHYRDKKRNYKPTVDQPAMTAKMDLVKCRERSPSFAKLCRELEKRRPVAYAVEETP